MMDIPRNWKAISISVAMATLVGCNSSSNTVTILPVIPFNLGPITSTYYDGVNDGLLGGFGLSGFRASPTFYADPNNPTKAEIRRHTIYLNYRALLDTSTAGGFGRLYGPLDDTTYPGYEYLAFVGEGHNRATLMVQIPDTFDVSKPCIIAAPSSGSRGVYGAVATSGAWGLKHGCAVAYTDANKGTGAVDLNQSIGFGIQHDANMLSTTDELTYRVPTQESVSSPSAEYAGVTLPTDQDLMTYIANNPNRYSFKHAHSQKNVEKDWGLHTLQAIKFAFQQLNEQFQGTTFDSDNTMVIAASVSNGGAAALRALEQDVEDLIDAVVVGEPNINPQTASQSFGIKSGGSTFTMHSKPAYEYFALAEMYAACASKAPANAGALFSELRGSVEGRCDALVAAGMLTDGTYEEEGTEALSKLTEAGFLPGSHKILVGYAGVDLFQSLVATYGNAYTRSSVVDSLCNVSMASVDAGTTAPSVNASVSTLAATSTGIPRTSNIYLIKDDAMGGPALQFAAVSSNGQADYNFEGAQCWYDLWANNTNPLNSRLMQGIDEVKGDGNLKGKPVIIVHGRDDALIPVNHSSRPYYALNHQVDGTDSNLKYYEITNAQHLDSLNQSYALAGMNYVPIDYYFKEGMDIMYDHLTNGTDLPPSQVVKTNAPVGNVALSDLTAISASPMHPIVFEGNDLVVPE